MINILTRTKSSTTTSHQLTLDGKALRDIISQELAAQGANRLPDNAYLCVEVPGGGDWSNTELDLDEQPLIVKWKETTGDDD